MKNADLPTPNLQGRGDGEGVQGGGRDALLDRHQAQVLQETQVPHHSLSGSLWSYIHLEICIIVIEMTMLTFIL